MLLYINKHFTTFQKDDVNNLEVGELTIQSDMLLWFYNHYLIVLITHWMNMYILKKINVNYFVSTASVKLVALNVTYIIDIGGKKFTVVFPISHPIKIFKCNFWCLKCLSEGKVDRLCLIFHHNAFIVTWMQSESGNLVAQRTMTFWTWLFKL